MQVQVAAIGAGEQLPSRASVNAEVTVKQFTDAARAWWTGPAAAPAAATAAAAAAAAVTVPPAVKDNLQSYRTFFLGFVAVERLDEIMGGDGVSPNEKLKAIYKEAVVTMTIHILFYLAAPNTTLPLANKINR